MKFLRKYYDKLSYDRKQSLRYVRCFFWTINWVKTLWINFKILPFRQAIKCPIIVAYNTKIKSVGRILFEGEIYTGMFLLGVMRVRDYESNHQPTIFNNCGCIHIKGRVRLNSGVALFVNRGANIFLGKLVGIGANSRVVCYREISFGDDVRISWNNQIFDTDFHFLYNIDKNHYYPRTKPVAIGSNVFIGNGCTIGKGTKIPDGCVVSCISKVSGDFTAEGENLLIMGNPASVIKKGINMSSTWFPEKESEIAKLLEDGQHS